MAAPSPNEALHSAGVKHQIGLLRLSEATIRKMIALLAGVEADLIERLFRLDPENAGANRLQAILEEVRTLQREGYRTLSTTLMQEMEALAVYEAGFQSRLLNGQLGFMTARPPLPNVIAAVNARPFQGRLLREWLNDLDASAARRVRDAIRMGVVEGETNAQIVRRLRGTRAQRYRDGIMEINRRGARTLVRTAVNHTADAARREVYRANSDIIGGVMYVATLDSRTTLTCASLDGRVFPIDKGPRPPQHLNCRSTTVPVLKGQDPAPRVTFKQWFEGAGAEIQLEVLGAGRYRLWKAGLLPIERFVNREGRAWTLAELARRESGAFDLAGLTEAG